MKKRMRMTMKIEKTFKDGCDDYLLDCKARNLREGTLKHYTDVMKQLYRYIPADTPKAEKPSNWDGVIEHWKAGEITAVKAMELTGTKKTTFYKLLKE